MHAALTDLLLDYLKDSAANEGGSSPVVVSDELTRELAGCCTTAMVKDLDSLYDKVTDEKVPSDDANNLLQSESLLNLNTLLQDLKCRLSQESRTSRLWLLYMRYVELLKLFLLGERTGNFLIHLHAVQMN